jgi:hypothetical protein
MMTAAHKCPRAQVSDRSELLRIAASMLHNRNFPSVYPEDHPKRTPRRIIEAAQKTQDQLRDWAVELAAIARRMDAQTPSPSNQADSR